ncbi:MAG: hypothetical protein CMN32_10065 [Saprospirales bacterium]|nr:hypothetical protein [Saprospirales bacterium]
MAIDFLVCYTSGFQQETLKSKRIQALLFRPVWKGKINEGKFATKGANKKKPCQKSIDRDKTKNKHYEQTLFLCRRKKGEKSPPVRPGAT